MERPPRSRTYALLGAAALVLQTVFVREFLALFHGSELFAGAVIGVWLLWVGLGSAAGELASRRLDPARTLVALYAVLGFLSPVLVPLARRLPITFGVPPGVLPPMHVAVGVAAAGMMLPCLLVGATFSLTAAVRRDAGRVYMWDALGGLAAGILVAALLVLLSPDATALPSLAAVLFGTLSALWGWGLARTAWRLPGPAVALLGLVSLAAAGTRGAVERATLAWAFPSERVERWEEAPDGRWIATRAGRSTDAGSINIYVGGALVRSGVDETGTEEFAALASLMHPDPRRVAVLSHPADPLPAAIAAACPGVLSGTGGAGRKLPGVLSDTGGAGRKLAGLQSGTGGAGRKLPGVLSGTGGAARRSVPSVDRTERGRKLPGAEVRAVVPHLGSFAGKLMGQPRDGGVDYVAGDARAFLRSLDGRTDLIVYQPGLPEAFLSSRLVTREAFAEARRALAAGGVLAVRLPFATSYRNEAVRKTVASIHRAVVEHFDHVRLEPMPAAGIVLLASSDPLADVDAIEERYRKRMAAKGDAEPALPSFRPALLGSGVERAFKLDDLARDIAQTEALPNTDFLPAAIWYQERATRTMYGRETWTARLEPGTAWPGIAFALLAVIGCVSLSRVRGGRAAGSALAFAAGCAGMMIEVSILCAYQVNCGSLYREVSLLLALVMAGTAAGAHLGGRAARGLARAGVRKRLLWSACGAAPALVIALLLLTCPSALDRVVLWVLAASTGAAVGAAYPVALALGRGADSARARTGGPPSLLRSCGGRKPSVALAEEGGAGYVYAADLAGAATGSILGGGIFIPLLGLAGAALVAIALALAAVFVIATAGVGREA